MFLAKFAQSGLLKKLVSTMHHFGTHIHLDFSSVGISVAKLSDDHTALLVISLMVDGFEEFVSGIATIGLRVRDLDEVLSGSKNEDPITIYFTEPNPKFVTVLLSGEGRVNQIENTNSNDQAMVGPLGNQSASG